MYPDGEVLTYDYDVGGQMHAVHGRKGSYDYPYVQRLDYDKFGQRTYVLHGNNTVSRYSYDPYDRRLSYLTVGKGDGNPFMDLSYGYDQVGNITDLANRATNNSPSQMGGATSYSYQYDDLYRLTDSSGTFDAPPGKQHRFTLSMGYDTIHNITHKTQVDVLRQPSGQEVTQKKTTYDWTYRYDGDQPHAPTHLGDRTFTYDANGNQRGWSHDTNGTRRQITWDDENRIREIKDNGHRLTYTYDASGQRLIKRGPQGETGYINQWFTLRNGEVGTKHVYAGTTRVVSKLVKQDKPNSKRKGRIVYEKDQYTYHPDHLGTSAYITHTNGQVYQHLEYFPFGETWVEEHSNKQRTPYLFTAKELDEESQLYYFGARYYDPRTSVWQSADPILSDYLDSERGLGGIYNFKNLGMYSYSHLNPTKYQDPDGNSTVLDNMNYVVSVNQNDGDFSIYRPVAGTGTVLKPGYGGREKIGESAFIDSFVSPDSGNPVGIVYPGQSMDGFMEKLHLEAKMESGPKILGIKSQPGWKYDVKSQFPGHENMSYHGFLFKGKYVSLRDAGNILAGMNAAAHGIPFDDFQKAAGALHSGGKPGLLWHWMTGNTYGTAPNWGEIDYQRTRSEFGYKLIAR